MTPLPDPAVTVVYIDHDGRVTVATNVSPVADVKVTTSLLEFDTLRAGLPFLIPSPNADTQLALPL